MSLQFIDIFYVFILPFSIFNAINAELISNPLSHASQFKRNVNVPRHKKLTQIIFPSSSSSSTSIQKRGSSTTSTQALSPSYFYSDLSGANDIENNDQPAEGTHQDNADFEIDNNHLKNNILYAQLRQQQDQVKQQQSYTASNSNRDAAALDSQAAVGNQLLQHESGVYAAPQHESVVVGTPKLLYGQRSTAPRLDKPGELLGRKELVDDQLQPPQIPSHAQKQLQLQYITPAAPTQNEAGLQHFNQNALADQQSAAFSAPALLYGTPSLLNRRLKSQSQQYSFAPEREEESRTLSTAMIPYPPSFIDITTVRSVMYPPAYFQKAPEITLPVPDLFTHRQPKSLLDSYIPSWVVLRIMEAYQQHQQHYADFGLSSYSPQRKRKSVLAKNSKYFKKLTEKQIEEKDEELLITS